MSDHEHRMEQDGAGWRAVVAYGRHTRDFWSSDVNRAVVKLADPTDGEIALDIGAGMGAGVFVAAGLVGRAGRVLAVEPTPFMRRALAVRRRTNRHRHRVEILDGVAEDLPISSDRVDVAWAVNVLHHISDLDRAMLEIKRVLAPGARVILVDEDFDDPAHPEHERMKEHHGHHHGGDHHHDTDDDGRHHLMVDVDELGQTMRSHGFTAVHSGARTLAEVPVLMAMARMPDHAPAPGYATVTPYLTVSDTNAALDWYRDHLGAEVTFEPLQMDDGRVGHAEIDIGGSRVMLADEFAEMNLEGPQARGGPTASFVVWVTDADATVERAAADGATIERPVDEQPHGARAGWLVDPFGHRWNVSTHHTDESASGVRRRIVEGMG